MNCGKVSELLSPYLDGELEPSERTFVFSHLKTCPACHRELEELQAAVQVFRQLPELAPAPAFRPGLRERLTKEMRLSAVGPRGPVAVPEGGREIRSAPRFPGAAVQDVRPGESRGAPCRTGLRTFLGAVLSSVGIWPKLAVAATLLLALGIASLWYGLAGPGLMPQLPVEQTAGSPSSKNRGAQQWLANLDRNPERKTAGGSSTGLSATRPEETGPFPTQETAPEQMPQAALGSRKEPEGQLLAKTGQPVQKEFWASAPKTVLRQEENAHHQQGLLTSEKTREPAAGTTGAGVAQPAPPKKASRQVEIELTGADAQKLSFLLAEFARRTEQTEATGPAPLASVAKPDSLAGKVEISKMPEFLAQVKLLGKILKQEETVRDLTTDYSKLETELNEKQLQEEELQKTILAQNKNNRSIRETDSSLQEELTKIQMEIQSIKKELQIMDEELRTVEVTIYLQK